MSQVERRRPFKFVFEQGRDLNQQMKGSAKNDAIDKSMNAEARHEEYRAEDLPKIIHSRCKCGQEKMLVGLQACHDEPTDRKDDRANQVQAHQFCKQLALLWAKAGCDADLSIHNLLRKNGDNNGCTACN